MTLDLSTQFIDGGAVGVPLDARIELLHETGRMLFLCGRIGQSGSSTIASFTGTLCKSASPA